MGDIKVVEINEVRVSGRLTRDVELRYTESGLAVADISIAVNTSTYSKEKGRQEHTCFVDTTVWRKTAEMAAEHLRKGKPVYIAGRLESEEWETQDGHKRKKVKIAADRVQFLEWPDKDEQPAPAKQEAPPTNDDDSDIPF